MQIPLIHEHIFCKYFARQSVGQTTKGRNVFTFNRSLTDASNEKINIFHILIDKFEPLNNLLGDDVTELRDLGGLGQSAQLSPLVVALKRITRYFLGGIPYTTLGSQIPPPPIFVFSSSTFMLILG